MSETKIIPSPVELTRHQDQMRETQSLLLQGWALVMLQEWDSSGICRLCKNGQGEGHERSCEARRWIQETGDFLRG
jgi:hypothetical protein